MALEAIETNLHRLFEVLAPIYTIIIAAAQQICDLVANIPPVLCRIITAIVSITAFHIITTQPRLRFLVLLPINKIKSFALWLQKNTTHTLSSAWMLLCRRWLLVLLCLSTAVNLFLCVYTVSTLGKPCYGRSDSGNDLQLTPKGTGDVTREPPMFAIEGTYMLPVHQRLTHHTTTDYCPARDFSMFSTCFATALVGDVEGAVKTVRPETQLETTTNYFGPELPICVIILLLGSMWMLASGRNGCKKMNWGHFPVHGRHGLAVSVPVDVRLKPEGTRIFKLGECFSV